MRNPQGAVFVLPLRPKRLMLPAALLIPLVALLLWQKPTTAALAPVPTEAPPELQLLPPETYMVVHFNVAGLLKSDITRPLFDLMIPTTRRKPEDLGLEELGVRFTDIKSVAVLAGERQLLYVVTTHKPFDGDKVIKANAPQAKVHIIKGRNVHIMDEGDERIPRFKDDGFPKDARPQPRRYSSWTPAVLLLSDRTYIRGDARSVVDFAETAVKVDDKHRLASTLTKAGTPHITAGISLPAELRDEMRDNLRRALWRELDGDPVSGLTLAAMRPLFEARGGTLTADFSDNSRAEVVAQFDTARAAGKGRDAAKFLLQMLKGGVGYIEDEMTELLGGPDKVSGSKMLPLFDAAREGLDGGTMKVDGTTLRVSVKLKTEATAVKAFWTDTVALVKGSAERITAVNNLRQIGIAIHNYAAVNRDQLPPAILSKDGKPLFSWRVALLPHIEQDNLYRALKLDEPWDSEHNKKVLEKVKTPSVYEMPGTKALGGHTYFRMFVGGGTVYPDGKQSRFSIGNMPDGTANTIAVVEAAESVHWAAPDEFTVSRTAPLKQLGNHYGRGPLALMYDGSVFSLSKKLKETTLRNAINPAEGSVLGDDWRSDDQRRGRHGSKERYPSKDRAMSKTAEPRPTQSEKPPPPPPPPPEE